MRANFKNAIETKYQEKCRELYISWKTGSKKKHEELMRNGLATSGMGVKMMCSFVEELVNNTLKEIEKIFIETPNQYNRKISVKNLKEYKKQIQKSLEGHINLMFKEIQNMYSEKVTNSSEGIASLFENIKGNTKNKVEAIFEENIDLRKGRKIEWQGTINLIVAIIGCIVGIIGLMGQLKKKDQTNEINTYVEMYVEE